MYQEQIAIKHNILTLGPFTTSDIPANTSDIAAALPGGNTGVPALKDGFVVGLTGKLSAAAGSGSLTIGVTVAGTEDTDNRVTITTQQDVVASFAEGDIPFSQGDDLGIEVNTDASWDGTTADLDIFLHVLVKGMEF